MKKFRPTKTTLIAGVAAVALFGGACAANDGTVSPGQEDPGATETESSTMTTGGSTTG